MSKGYIDKVKAAWDNLSWKQINEEKANHEYLENINYLDKEYEIFIKMDTTKRRAMNQEFI